MRATLLFAGICMLCLALTQASVQPMEKEVEVDAAVHRRRLAELGAAKCIRDAKISILTGAEPEYYQARKVFSKDFESWPSAIVQPANTNQVATAVRCANQWGVRVIPRCGGHGNEGESMAVAAITVDLQAKMTGATLGADGFATVQGGSTAGMAVRNLLTASNNTLGFPIGQRPVVGFSGFALVGGFGLATRLGGLGCDQVVAVKGVDHSGKVVQASADQNTDLLWATLGGGGGNLFIVTEWTLRTMNVSGGVTVFEVVVPMVESYVQTYLNWTADPNMDRRANIECETDSEYYIRIHGWFMGSRQQALFFLQTSGLPKTGPMAPANFKVEHFKYIDALVKQIGWDSPKNADPLLWQYNEEMSFYKYKSMAVFNGYMPQKSIWEIMYYAKVPGAVWQFNHFGGEVGRVPLDATAVPFRTASHFLIMRANSKNDTIARNALMEATKLLEVLIENSDRYLAYTGFIDTSIPSLTNMQDAFYGDSLHALQCANAKYDPHDKFFTPITLGMPGAEVTGQSVPGIDPKSECATLLAAKGKAAAARVKQLLAGGGTFGP